MLLRATSEGVTRLPDSKDVQRSAAAFAAADPIHANSAGCSVLPDHVLDVVIEHLRLAAALGGYEAQAQVSSELAQVYIELGKLIGCKSSQIALFDSATSAWRTVLRTFSFERGDRVAITTAEYGTNVADLLRLRAERDLHISVLSLAPGGRINTDELASSLGAGARIVAVPYVAANGTVLTNIPAVAEQVMNANAVLIVDASQALGHLPIDVQSLGCHILTFTGRKYLRAPRGTGGMFVRDDVASHLLHPLRSELGMYSGSIDCRKMRAIRGLESREKDPAILLGLLASVRHANDIKMDETTNKILALAAGLRHAIARIPGWTIHDRPPYSGIVTASHRTIPARAVKNSLRQEGISVGVTGGAATPLDMEERGLSEVLRVSPHYFNTTGEMERISTAIQRITAAA